MSTIDDPASALFALMAMYAEDMFDPNRTTLSPPLHPRMANDWTLIGHLTAADALLIGRKLGLGQRVFYGFMAQSNHHPDQFVAVVRGTEGTVEWIEDFDAALVPAPGGAGMVEHGFYSIYASMLFALGGGPVPVPPASNPSAAQGIAGALPPGTTVTVIGHSLGSALATYLMADLARAGGNFSVKGCLIASPRAADGTYGRAVDAAVGSANYIVYNYLRDIVPHVPPSLPLGLGFQALPHSVWIRPGDAQAKIRFDLFCHHHAYCYAAMLDYTAVQAMDPAARPCVLGKA